MRPGAAGDWKRHRGDWALFPSLHAADSSHGFDRSITLQDAKSLLRCGTFPLELLAALEHAPRMDWSSQSIHRRSSVLNCAQTFLDAARRETRVDLVPNLTAALSALERAESSLSTPWLPANTMLHSYSPTAGPETASTLRAPKRPRTSAHSVTFCPVTTIQHICDHSDGTSQSTDMHFSVEQSGLVETASSPPSSQRD
jgi:hypothetical protein